MKPGSTLTTVAMIMSATAGHAVDSALVLGKSTYNARCAMCHGTSGKGDGEVAELFKIPPSDLTKLAERADGEFPYAYVSGVLSEGMQQAGHGEAEMPIWGDYFVADALEDRGIFPEDAEAIAAGRILSLAHYLESIQE